VGAQKTITKKYLEQAANMIDFIGKAENDFLVRLLKWEVPFTKF
jgi:hypothetical protein